ncbi:Maltase 1 [Camponotus floridanus]|uniref:alpha-glucosidase n=1 Tax=Camponotus floridanus TaxID=104421 RepID=E2ASA4_CAMFO|nr:Maltase 1 [Camponotus floridanus]
MTEAYTSLENTTKYYKFGSHVPFNFKFISDVNNVSKAADFKRIIDDWMSQTPNDESPNWVMGNHDKSRTASRYPGRGDQMIMLEMILPGIAVTYNGEEIGMLDKRDISWEDTQDPQACNAGKDKYQNLSRDRNRTPFQWDATKNAGFSKANHTWLPVHENYIELNLAKQKIANESHYKIYTSLIKMRQREAALQQGNLTTLVQRITSKLSYFKDTGINAISLSPICSSSNLEYGIIDYTDIDPIYGTLEDFKALLRRAQKLGVIVVLDLVPNHSSDEHLWFQKALQGHKKYKGYYIWAEGKNKDNKTPPNNWISISGGPAWTYVKSLKQWYLHQYGPGLPDLNYSNSAVIQEMQNILTFWLDTGIDGFRVDSAAFIFEDKKLRDEPRSNATGETPQDYGYLNHIYTTDQIASYELFGSWKKYLDEYADEDNQDQKLLVMEAYTSFPHTIQYYDYNVLPFNFMFIVNLTAKSSAKDFKEKIDLWINSIPHGEVSNWVVRIHTKSS